VTRRCRQARHRLTRPHKLTNAAGSLARRPSRLVRLELHARGTSAAIRSCRFALVAAAVVPLLPLRAVGGFYSLGRVGPGADHRHECRVGCRLRFIARISIASHFPPGTPRRQPTASSSARPSGAIAVHAPRPTTLTRAESRKSLCHWQE